MGVKTQTLGVQSAAVRIRRSPLRGERFFAFMLTLPALIAVLAVIGFPWVYSAVMSVTEENMFTKTKEFVGLNNYLMVIPDPIFQGAAWRTFYFAIVSVIGGGLLGLGMALVLNERFKGRGLMRSVLLVPWATAPVMAGVIWAWIFNGEYGSLNAVLYYGLGIIPEYVAWLNNGFVALNLVALVFIWNQAPLAALLYLAAIQSIPPSLYAAAKVDGASAWQRFWRITLPWLRSMILLVLILSSINALMQFDLIFLITSGGPGWDTTVFSWLGYSKAFRDFKFGEGAAILYVLSLVSLVLAVVYIKVLGLTRET